MYKQNFVLSNLQRLMRHKTNRFLKSPVYIQGAHNKFPDFFRMGTFIDCTHMKL